MSEFITDGLASPVGGVGVGTEEERNVVVLRCILQRKYDLRTPEPIHQTADTHYVYYIIVMYNRACSYVHQHT